MPTSNEVETAACAICGQPTCPCPQCHGDPIHYYGVFQSCCPGAEAEADVCVKCGAVIG